MSIEVNKIYNEDCFETMRKMDPKSISIVLTSPPYNMTQRKGGYADKYERYDVYNDWMEERYYIEWTIDLFKSFDNVVKNDRVVLYNFSYSIENPSLPYNLVSAIQSNTNWCIADTIIWKKKNSIPHPASYNRLNRITEFIFVFCRKNELKTFKMFKNVVKTSKKGQKYYEIVDNFIEAKNNDKPTGINKATYSTELCKKLMNVYATDGDIVYDSFMGTGTTARACKSIGINFIGSEISKDQCEYAEKSVKSVEPIIIFDDIYPKTRVDT